MNRFKTNSFSLNATVTLNICCVIKIYVSKTTLTPNPYRGEPPHKGCSSWTKLKYLNWVPKNYRFSLILVNTSSILFIT